MRSVGLTLCAVGVLGVQICAAHDGGGDWDYDLQGADWYLGPCDTATSRQSPVAFEFKEIPNRFSVEKSIKIAWNVIRTTDYEKVYSDGRKVAVKPREGENFGSIFTMDQKRFDFIDTHFHAPAEHTLGTRPVDASRREPLAVHFVHLEEDGELLVVGVLFKSDANAARGVIGDIADSIKNGDHKDLDFGSLLNREMGDMFYHYAGSLTTPPCTEIVRWYVLKEPIGALPEDIETIAAKLQDPHDLGNYRLQQNLPPDVYFSALPVDSAPPYPGPLNTNPVYKTFGHLVFSEEVPIYERAIRMSAAWIREVVSRAPNEPRGPNLRGPGAGRGGSNSARPTPTAAPRPTTTPRTAPPPTTRPTTAGGAPKPPQPQSVDATDCSLTEEGC